MSPALRGAFFTCSTTWEAHCIPYSNRAFKLVVDDNSQSPPTHFLLLEDWDPVIVITIILQTGHTFNINI